MHWRQINIRTILLSAVCCESEVFLNCTEEFPYVQHIYLISEAKWHAKIHACDCEEGFLLLQLITLKLANASHRMITRNVVCSKCRVRSARYVQACSGQNLKEINTTRRRTGSECNALLMIILSITFYSKNS